MSAVVGTRRRRFSDEFKRSAVARVRAGESVAGVARDMGVASCVIVEWRHVENGTSKSKKRRAPPVKANRPTRAAPPELKEAVLAALEARMPWDDITRTHGVVASTIYKWARRSGRFGFGEVATFERVGEEPPATDWWRRMKGVDEASAATAMRLLERGTTRIELARETGWRDWTVTAFVRKAHAFQGLPLLLPAPHRIPVDTSAIATVDLSREPAPDPVSTIDLGAGVVVPLRVRIHTEETVRNALALIDRGLSLEAVSTRFGVTLRLVAYWKDRRDGKSTVKQRRRTDRGERSGDAPATGPRQKRVPIETKAAILGEVAAGGKVKEVAPRYGLSYSTVYQIMARSPHFAHGKGAGSRPGIHRPRSRGRVDGASSEATGVGESP